MKIKAGVLVFFILIMASGTASGVPANPAPFVLSQPDKTFFQARQVGDEKEAHFETLDGYTIIKDENGWWNFAKLDPGLISSGQKVGNVYGTPDLPKHLQKPQDIFAEQSEKQTGFIPKTSVRNVFSPQAGTKKALVILINFKDKLQDQSHTTVYFNDLVFNASPGAKSMNNYYKEVSYGKLNITGNIAGDRWFSASRNMSWYGSDITKLDENTNDPDPNNWFIFKLAKEAIIEADPYVNYADYDMDKDGIIDNLIIVHSGNGQETSGSLTDIWSHRWTISVWDGAQWNTGFMTDDGVKAVGYTMQAESSNLGTFAHEFGHDLGLPDLYNTNNNLPGVGYWDLMGLGVWLDNGKTPGHLSAWSKYFLGWVKPWKVTTSLIDQQINQSETNDDVYMLLDNPGDIPGNLDWTPEGNGTGEYFLVENRRKTGYDAFLPGEGLLIWHIDETQMNNNNESRKLVDLEEADGRNDLDNGVTGNMGDAFDPWYTNISGFMNSSNPGSSLYNGSESGIRVTNISPAGSTMTTNLIVGPTMSFVSPTLLNGTVISRNWIFLNATSDETLMKAAELEWNGAREAMMEGKNSWYKNKTQLFDGIYNFRVWGMNSGGRSNSTEMRTVIIDTDSPVVLIDSPPDRSFVNTPIIYVNGSAKDKSGLKRNCIGSNGNKTCKDMEGRANFTGFNHSVKLDEGSNYININFSDPAGNNGMASVNVTLDTISPVVTIDSPGNGAAVSLPDIFVNGTANDNSAIKSHCLEINGDKSCKDLDNRSNFTVFNHSIKLNEGSNRIIINYSDVAGNKGSASVNVTWVVTNYWPYVNISVNTTANNVTLINALDEVNTTLELFTIEDARNEYINIIMRNDIPKGMNLTLPLTAPGKYVEINAGESLRNSISSGWLIIKIYYTGSELKGLDENSLKISWYNDSYPARWELLNKDSPIWVHGSGVESADFKGFAGYAWANVSHLGTFGIFGNYPAAPIQPGGSSGSSGGGGGAGTSGENYTNIEISEKYDMPIYKDKVTSYRFTNTKNPILYLNITGNVSTEAITAMVEVLKGASTLVTAPPPGIINKNANIWIGIKGFATPRNIREAVIKFRVESSWIRSNDLEGSDIRLFRWDGIQWKMLETSEKENDSIFTYFEAKTDSFSPFAIGALKEVKSAAVQIVTAAPIPMKTAIIPAETKTPSSNRAWIIGILLVAGIVIFLYLYRKKKSGLPTIFGS